jgi:hypothetical protein
VGPFEATIAATGTKNGRIAHVLVFVASIKRTRIIQQEYAMNAGSHAARPIDKQPNISGVPLDFPTCAPDSFEGRHRLLTEFERIKQPSERDHPVIGRWRSVGAADGLEEGLHWLISAAVLACLALVIFGL